MEEHDMLYNYGFSTFQKGLPGVDFGILKNSEKYGTLFAAFWRTLSGREKALYAYVSDTNTLLSMISQDIA